LGCSKNEHKMAAGTAVDAIVKCAVHLFM